MKRQRHSLNDDFLVVICGVLFIVWPPLAVWIPTVYDNKSGFVDLDALQ